MTPRQSTALQEMPGFATQAPLFPCAPSLERWTMVVCHSPKAGALQTHQTVEVWEKEAVNLSFILVWSSPDLLWTTAPPPALISWSWIFLWLLTCRAARAWKLLGQLLLPARNSIFCQDLFFWALLGLRAWLGPRASCTSANHCFEYDAAGLGQERGQFWLWAVHQLNQNH